MMAPGESCQCSTAERDNRRGRGSTAWKSTLTGKSLPRTSADVVKSSEGGDDVFLLTRTEMVKEAGVLLVPLKGSGGAFFLLRRGLIDPDSNNLQEVS